MKTKIFTITGLLALIVLGLIPNSTKAQEIQYFRPNNMQGINVFETTKLDTVAFTGLKVHIGGNFELAYQILKDQNTAVPATSKGIPTTAGSATNFTTPLLKLTDGFVLPMANLNFDIQLADGVRLNLTSYLATRHHEDTWVKGGYIQFDKLPFLHSQLADNIMKNVTIRIGQTDVDYGDQHFRRSDGGNTIYNPFVENYIMDEFATEMGGEFYYHCKSGLFAMGAISDGILNETVVAPTKIDSATSQINKFEPAFHGKLGFDKQLTKDFRLRLTGSFYTVSSSNGSTLFGGDRTGSHYYNVMENQNAANAAVLNDAVDYNFTSGRFNPGFSEEVHTFMGNLFLKYKGLEFFGTIEDAHGRSITEFTNRKATQYAGDVVYRFPEKTQNFWIGARYNTVTAAILGNPTNVTVNRTVGSFGWFMTANIMAKVEYVDQVYKGYAPTNILNGGKFNGLMLEASIGF